MTNGEARARLIALAQNNPKGVQRDALIMGATALIDDVNNIWLQEHDKRIRAEVIEFISDNLIYPLLDEYDRGLWERISYIELAEEWIIALDNNPYPKVKNNTEAIKKELRQWIAEQLKERNK